MDLEQRKVALEIKMLRSKLKREGNSLTRIVKDEVRLKYLELNYDQNGMPKLRHSVPIRTNLRARKE